MKLYITALDDDKEPESGEVEITWDNTWDELSWDEKAYTSEQNDIIVDAINKRYHYILSEIEKEDKEAMCEAD